ncbi:MAG: hypothetical protein ACRELG_08880, partial [Gemmataceae bacterium]
PRGPEPAAPSSWWELCWDVWWRPIPPRSIDRETVLLHDFRFPIQERRRRFQKYLQSHAWQASVAASAIAGSLTHGPVPNSLLALSWSSTYHDLFPPGALQPARRPRASEQEAIRAWLLYMNSQPIEPPTSLYLGIRAARRALVVDPEDGPTYLMLGRAYQRLRDQPQEGALRTSAPRMLLLAIRRTQMIAAFHNCLRLQPNLESAAQAHEALFAVYAPPPMGQLGYLDAAVHHLREALDKRTAAGPPPGVSATPYNQKLDRMSAELVKQEAELDRQRNRYDLRTVSKSGLEKVKVALELGLMETALATLEEAAEEEIVTRAVMPLLKQVTGVALDLGRLDRARELLLPDPESMAGQPVRPDYLALHVRLAAARGDYADADRLLADALRHAWKPPVGQMTQLDLVRMTAETIGHVLLTGSQLRTIAIAPRFPARSPFWVRRWGLEAVANGLNAALEQADYHLVRGWLALEAGHCIEARKHFEIVRDITVPGKNWIPEVNRVNAWRSPEREIQTFQQLGRQHNFLHDLSERYLNWLVEERR